MNKRAALHNYIMLVVFAILVSCKGGETANPHGDGDTIAFKYAENIVAVRYSDCTVVTLKDPWNEGKSLQTYVLVSRSDSGKVGSLPAGTVVYTPLRRSVVFASTHCRLLSWLGAADRIRGVCDSKYILSDEVRRKLRDGAVADCGDGIYPDMERIVDIRADALLVSPFENSGGFDKLRSLGVPVVQCADYMETSALGRAEWMRFYGLLYGCAATADSLFNVVDHTYNELKRAAAGMARSRSALFDRKTGGVWYCPGGRSTVGQTVADANGGYAFSADTHSGSLALSIEQVLAKAAQSDVWLLKYNGGGQLSRKALLAEYYGYAGLAAFKSGEVYMCDTQATPYFDEVPFRPDYLLREMMILLHPDEAAGLGGLRYYKKMER